MVFLTLIMLRKYEMIMVPILNEMFMNIYILYICLYENVYDWIHGYPMLQR